MPHLALPLQRHAHHAVAARLNASGQRQGAVGALFGSLMFNSNAAPPGAAAG
jgi:hypothetical protein